MKIIETFERLQRYLEEKSRTLGRGKYGRILRMARRPTRDEYSKSLWITSIGMALIGGMGFAVYFIWTYLPPWLHRILHI